MHFANVSAAMVQSNYPPLLSVFRIINVLLTFYCSSTAGKAVPAGSAFSSSVFAGKKQSSLSKSTAQILVRAFFVAKKAQQFEFDWLNLNFDQSGAKFSNSSAKVCMH